ncbi:MAG: hypothetical protein SFZ03_02690 [Candidatus Melainabacteria bacterium]|nr:hypothetical protein [Candidatus Melainabacteria bacterium]
MGQPANDSQSSASQMRHPLQVAPENPSYQATSQALSMLEQLIVGQETKRYRRSATEDALLQASSQSNPEQRLHHSTVDMLKRLSVSAPLPHSANAYEDLAYLSAEAALLDEGIQLGATHSTEMFIEQMVHHLKAERLL